MKLVRDRRCFPPPLLLPPLGDLSVRSKIEGNTNYLFGFNKTLGSGSARVFVSYYGNS